MTPRAEHERRRADRRQADRRGPPRFSVSEPWSGTAAAGLDEVDPGLADGGPPVAGEGAALPRILRTYMVARGALAVVLVLAPWSVVLTGGHLPLPMMLVCLAYAGQAISLWLLPGLAGDDRPAHDRLSRSQWGMTIGVDVATFSLLRLLDDSSHLNYAALLVLPVLMAGVLTRRLAALATAAVVTLVLLAGAVSTALSEGGVMLQLSQAGLAGAGLFIITVLAGELSQRLAREERAARGSLTLAHQQTQLNRVVIEEMTEGVLVVDRQGAVRALNPAAQALLGAASARQAPPFALAIEPAWQPLQSAIEHAYLQGWWPDDARVLDWAVSGQGRCTVQVRARFTRRSGIGMGKKPPEDFCVLFLEDARLAQARSSQERLAAMGRMSAGIAHEIRNPLAAIAQANALLLEDGLAPEHERLARMVDDNVERLKRIVDDVMAVSPGALQPTSVIDVGQDLAAMCTDWLRTAPASERHDRLSLSWSSSSAPSPSGSPAPDQPLLALFDHDHLRRVLVNLLDNAARHASQAAGAIQVRLQPLARAGVVEIVVASDGAAIAPEIERHLFEPFFSTRSRGSGLGLYICRELCSRHGASIEFVPGGAKDTHRNAFRVLLRGVAQREVAAT